LMIKLQVDEYYNGLKKKKSEKVCSILETIKDISQVAQTLSNFSQINELYKEEVSIHSMLDEILMDLYNHPNIDSIEVNIGKEFVLQADEKLLKAALKNIISNALDAVTADRQITILVKQVDQVISIIIKNSTDIIQEEFEKIEEIGFTTKKTGSGLGIPIARSIIEKHDGKFQVLLQEGYFIVEIFLPYID
ncbi:MAG TPA: HAMP domain-containing histidine kinase, partial [Candidatus Cloacimonetes bacterium]|nr:HAMP domain-containing histidine kinase [Candidatus Cloacimonadota bacterium]HEX38355.1 HAMP domain-containing histidine kinase [Candidatus Cloacimonadota bacterium]